MRDSPDVDGFVVRVMVTNAEIASARYSQIDWLEILIARFRRDVEALIEKEEL
jgi:hypothetical protein